MAVELGLNRFVATPPVSETEFQRLERRNRERTYLVLFVHDRSLSMQTGRHWMLPEDELVRRAATWHQASGGPVRPEDVVIAAFVSLRRIAVKFFLSSFFILFYIYFLLTLIMPTQQAETTDIFNASKGSSNSDINYEVVLSNCNARLTQWDDVWRQETEKGLQNLLLFILFIIFSTPFPAGGDKFHLSFLTFFRLHVRLFLNSFGIHPSMLPVSTIY